MSKCVFCDIYGEGKEVIYENESVFSRFDKYPVSPGHVEIIPIRHVVSLEDLTDVEWSGIRSAIEPILETLNDLSLRKVYENLIVNPLDNWSEHFCADMLNHIGVDQKIAKYNFGVNEGRLAGREIDHLHFHLIPRFKGDVKNPTGGIRSVIPAKGNYRK